MVTIWARSQNSARPGAFYGWRVTSAKSIGHRPAVLTAFRGGAAPEPGGYPVVIWLLLGGDFVRAAGFAKPSPFEPDVLPRRHVSSDRRRRARPLNGHIDGCSRS